MITWIFKQMLKTGTVVNKRYRGIADITGLDKVIRNRSETGEKYRTLMWMKIPL